MRTGTRICTILVLLVVATSALAFDGQRKGFIFGLDFGMGATYIKSKSELGDQSVWKGAPAVGFKIGLATNNRTVIFMGTKSSLAYMDRIANAYDTYTDAMGDGGLKGVFATIASPIVLPILWMGGAHSTFGLIGLAYYFQDQAPSFFVEGTLGAGIIPDEFREDTVGGFGMSVAAGYEFSPHYSIRCDLLYGTEERNQDEDRYPYTINPEPHSSAFSVLLTVNALAY